MASFDELPFELYEYIVCWLRNDDLKRLRSISKRLCLASTPALFAKVRLSLTPASWHAWHKIASQQALRDSVRTCVFNPQLLPHFSSEREWAECIDMRPFIGQYWYDRSEETGELVFADGHGHPARQEFKNAYSRLQDTPWYLDVEFASYQEAVDAQRRLITGKAFREEFSTLLSSFERLTTIKLTMWYEGWWAKPRATGGGTVSPYDMYYQWLKPKDTAVYKELAFSGIWEQGQSLKNSIVESGTVGTSLILELARAQGRGLKLEKLRSLDLYLSQTDAAFTYWYPDVRTSATPSDELLYAREVKRCLEVLPQVSIQNITVLNLMIQAYKSLDKGILEMPAVGHLLNSASSLVTLGLFLSPADALSGFERFGCDHLANFQSTRLPSLRNLRLASMIVSEDSLYTVLETYATTLTTLTLDDINLSSGAWVSFLKRLPQAVSLRNVSMHKLTEINYSEFDGLGNCYMFSNSEASEAVVKYVIGDADWPGLISDDPEPLSVSERFEYSWGSDPSVWEKPMSLLGTSEYWRG